MTNIRILPLTDQARYALTRWVEEQPEQRDVRYVIANSLTNRHDDRIVFVSRPPGTPPLTFMSFEEAADRFVPGWREQP